MLLWHCLLSLLNIISMSNIFQCYSCDSSSSNERAWIQLVLVIAAFYLSQNLACSYSSHFFFFFFFWLWPSHVKAQARDQIHATARPKPLQGQCQIFNLLHHKRTPKLFSNSSLSISRKNMKNMLETDIKGFSCLDV